MRRSGRQSPLVRKPFTFTALVIVLMGAAAGLGPSAWPGRAKTARAMAALEWLGIAGLSAGQRQRVLIVGAPAQEAHAVIMDEPSPSLDFANRLQVNALVRGLAGEGTAAILWTHDPR
ncbi:MAG: ABC transporter ATP-binding protein, partial [Paracoccus sp. (in: a-proteobacteria)]